jgi:hypothetical protein
MCLIHPTQLFVCVFLRVSHVWDEICALVKAAVFDSPHSHGAGHLLAKSLTDIMRHYRCRATLEPTAQTAPPEQRKLTLLFLYFASYKLHTASRTLFFLSKVSHSVTFLSRSTLRALCQTVSDSVVYICSGARGHRGEIGKGCDGYRPTNGWAPKVIDACGICGENTFFNKI